MKSTKMMYKRIMAFVLALVLMGSTFSSASVSAYATTGADIPVEVQSVEDTQDETVDESEDEATAEKTEVVVEDTESEDVDTEDVDTDTESDTTVKDEVVVEDEANAEDNAVVDDDTTVEDDVVVEDDANAETDADAEDDAVVDEDVVAEDEATVSENEIEDTVELMSDSEYDLYVGETGSNALGDYLYISADMVDKDVFSAGELEDYLENWADSDMDFNAVYINQRELEDADNVIRKADFNAARNLLVTDGSDTEIVFTFDNTYADEMGGYVYPEYADWSFYNPSEATADMKAEIEYDDYGYCGYDESDGTYYYGLTLEREKATFPSSGVDVTLSKDYNFLDGVFGYDENIPVEADEFEPLYGLIFSNIAKLTDVNSELFYWYSENDPDNGNDNVYKLQILDAQNLPTTECYAFPVKADPNSPYGVGEVLGEEHGLSISGNLALKSYDSEVAYASSTKNEVSLSIVNQGMFTYAHAYTEDSRPVVEVFEAEAITKLKEMKIMNHPKVGEGKYEVVMELPPKDGEQWDVREGLDLRLYPDSAGQYWDCLDWELVNENSETPAIEFTENLGEFRALNPGKATITASYTQDGENKISVTCDVIVKNAVSDEFSGSNWGKFFTEGDPIAIMNYDKTLADVELPEGFTWVDDTEKLSAYAGMSGHDFAAIYKSPIDGREAKVSVWVEFVSVDSIVVGEMMTFATNDKGETIAAAPLENNVLSKGNVLSFFELNMYVPYHGEMSISDANDLFNKAGFGENFLYFVVKEGKTELPSYDGIPTYIAETAGKKTFTISLMATVDGKAKELKKTTLAITVPKNDVVDMNELILWKVLDKDSVEEGLIGEKGTYYFAIPSEPNFKLTAKNLATDVAKWGKTTNGTVSADDIPSSAIAPYKENPTEFVKASKYNYVAVQYTIIGEGFVKYSLTANDEVKTTTGTVIDKEYKDYLPRPQISAVTINSKTESKAAGLTWELETWEEAEAQKIANVGELKLTGKDADKFVIRKGDVTGSILPITIQLADKKDEEGNSIIVKNGKYKLTVETEVNVNGQPLEDPFTTEVTVTVTDKLPNVTVKQTKNVNLFYTYGDNAEYQEGYEYEEGDGLLTITTDPGKNIKINEIKGQKGAELDYYLEQIGESNVYAIKWKDGNEGKNTKAELIVSIDGYDVAVSKTLNIKKETKAPVITLSQTSDTLYSNYMVGDNLKSELQIKANGEPMDIWAVFIGSKDSDLILSKAITDQLVSLKNNNKYRVWLDNDTISIDPQTDLNKGTDKFTFWVQEDNWSNPVSISYSVKVDTSVPKLELGTKTITLNRNDAVFANQSEATTLQLKGGGVNLFAEELFSTEDYDTGYWISYVGKDTKSIKYMVNDLIINYNDEGLIVRLHDNSIPKGTYKYDIKVNKKGLPSVVTTLTVKIVEDAPEKCISVSGKSNIDVLDREGTSATYTAKLKNIAGKVVDGYITGADSDKFEAYFEDGKLVVKAREGAMFNTKTNYKVTPVFIVENAEGGSYELEGKEQKIKVKQGKPKVTMTSVAGNILYRGRTNELDVELDALLNKTEDVAINYVELAGNWDTFYIASVTGEFDDYGNPTDIKGLTISQHDNPGTIVNNGKTVNLKFNVYFTDAAGNEKATSVTYKMVVK